MAEKKQLDEPARLMVLPCVHSMIHAGRFVALGAWRELRFLPATLPSMLMFRVHQDNPDAIVIAEGEAFLSSAGGGRALAEVFADTPAILLVERPRASLQRMAARLNIHSVIPLEVGPHPLVTAIAATVEGFAVTASHPSPGKTEEIGVVEELTAREVEVLRAMARGRTNRQLAAELRISEHTVKFHVSSVLAKLGARTRTGAVTIGMTRGLVAV